MNRGMVSDSATEHLHTSLESAASPSLRAAFGLHALLISHCAKSIHCAPRTTASNSDLTLPMCHVTPLRNSVVGRPSTARLTNSRALSGSPKSCVCLDGNTLILKSWNSSILHPPSADNGDLMPERGRPAHCPVVYPPGLEETRLRPGGLGARRRAWREIRCSRGPYAHRSAGPLPNVGGPSQPGRARQRRDGTGNRHGRQECLAYIACLNSPNSALPEPTNPDNSRGQNDGSDAQRKAL